jgi:hypothetical protein
MKSYNIKYYSSGESDGADTEYIYVNYKIKPSPSDTIKIYDTPKTSYKVMSNTEKYRSIVLSEPENKVLVFSPPHSISLKEFQESNPTITDDIHINECIEGTMINLFYDPRIKSWEIATKSAIGAEYWYYRTEYKNKKLEGQQMTFRQMFIDAFREDINADLNSLAFLEYLSKEYSYTFVLKHPNNHIVQLVEYPVVYLVAVYHIRDDDVIYIPPIIYEEWDCFYNLRGLIEFPRSFDEIKYDYYMTNFETKSSMGYMMTNLKTGDRCHIENSSYSYLRELRGNHPNLQYQYLELKRIGRISEFLQFFPQYYSDFLFFYNEYCQFLSKLHKWYVSIYIKKEGIRSPKKYFPLIYKLHHEVFIPSMVSNAKIVMRKNVVGEYLSSQVSSSTLIYYFNMDEE